MEIAIYFVTVTSNHLIACISSLLIYMIADLIRLSSLNGVVKSRTFNFGSKFFKFPEFDLIYLDQNDDINVRDEKQLFFYIFEPTNTNTIETRENRQ